MTNILEIMMPNKIISDLTNSSVDIKEEDNTDNNLVTTFICENTDCVLEPLEQIKYSLNEVQLTYGSVVVLKNAP
jgi:aspartate carbamoyltransferase regulatory subunit